MHSLPNRFGYRSRGDRDLVVVVNTFTQRARRSDTSLPDTKKRLQRAANDIFAQMGRRNFT